MSIHNNNFKYKKRKSTLIIPNLWLGDFVPRDSFFKNEFETAVVYEPSVFKPLKFCCREEVLT